MIGGCVKRHKNSDMTTTEAIVKDYIATSMRRGGYNRDVWNVQYPVVNPSPAMETMRVLGEQFERAYFNNFDNMLDDFDVTAPDAEENFRGVAQVLFSNGVKWGRIIGLLVFASKLSLKAVHPDVNRRDLVDRVVAWTCSILQTPRVGNWMAANNNWAGFVDFYKNPQNREGDNGGMQWRELVTAGVATIAGAAAVLNFFQR